MRRFLAGVRARSLVPLVLSLLGASGACGGARDEGQADAIENARARGAVVAKVNGATIGLDQVRELVASTGLSPRDALARLEEEQLLAEEAQRRGYARLRSTGDDVKRALVQALLADTVEKLRTEDIALSEVRARFDDVARRAGLSADSFAQHETAVRAQLLLEKRKAALEKLASGLRAQLGVSLSEEEVQRLLSDPGFWRESS